ncbi:hypothetical protein [Paenibacillus konkukensis]|uniref:hypothetical protein n=1 Tax=Paenibacillus konkukensis TaxID=2020716 RepID=UPI00201D56E1|nr:hypothetical protein [Paenibacillus konkukensis]
MNLEKRKRSPLKTDSLRRKTKNNPKNPFSTAIGGSNGHRSGLFHHPFSVQAKIEKNCRKEVDKDD